MDNQVRDQLQQLIRRYGVVLCEEPKRLGGMLKDLCPAHKKETRVLLAALEERVAEQLLSLSKGIPPSAVLERLSEQLHEELAIKEAAAHWAVDSWALALGVIEQPRAAPAQQAASAPNTARPVNQGGAEPRLIQLPPGRFLMGSTEYSSEQPPHEVVIKAPFAIGQYPVTVGEFEHFVRATGYRTEAEKQGGAYVYNSKEWKKQADASWKKPYYQQSPRHPVVCVSWNDAQAYCRWLSDDSGKPYRLPSEAEWEYACRAATQSRYFFGDDEAELSDYAWFSENSVGQAHPVGEKQPNAWGLYDMHGNVWEWCEDVWHNNYQGAPLDGSAWVDGGDTSHRLLRGGSWDCYPDVCRAAYRNWFYPVNRNNGCGFRVLCSE